MPKVDICDNTYSKLFADCTDLLTFAYFTWRVQEQGDLEQKNFY